DFLEKPTRSAKTTAAIRVWRSIDEGVGFMSRIRARIAPFGRRGHPIPAVAPRGQRWGPAPPVRCLARPREQPRRPARQTLRAAPRPRPARPCPGVRPDHHHTCEEDAMRRSALNAARLLPVVASLMLISLFSTLPAAGPATPHASAEVATTPTNAVALPEGYPWIRLAESARTAVVNVRVKTERTGNEE